MPGNNLQRTSQTRLFVIEDRANPNKTPSYQFLARSLGVSWPQGDITPIRIPDPAQYSKFITVDRIKGQQGLPTLSIEGHLSRDISDFLRMVRKGCAFDVQLHAGACEDPQNFNQGWEKIYVLEGADATSYDTNELGALDGDQEAIVNETIAVSGIDYYEVKRVIGTEIAATELVQEIVGMTICDAASCGACGIPSDGCEKVFAVTKSHGGSPGLPAEVIFSADGGATIGQTTMTQLVSTEDPTDLACVGIYLAVVSNEALAVFYAPLADILNHIETWAKIATGFVVAKGPNAIFSLGSNLTWIVGDGGYIYFSSDITAGVTVQSAGSASVQNLAAIHGFDEDNLVAVGASNAVLFTNNGGSSWGSVTGPAVGIALTAVYMKSALVWFVGTANGKLFYTIDGGVSWTEKAFSGSGSGSVKDIDFSTPTVGYMAHNSTTPRGRILRTVNGGNSWYVLPEQAGLSLPQGDSFNKLAVCNEDPNLVFAGGLADNATDGIFVKIS